jgi:hypothetical protein
MLLALGLALGVTLAAVPGGGQTVVAPPSWLGLTLETPAAGLRAVLGDPVRVTKLPDELPAGQTTTSGVPERKARYVISVQPLLFAVVTERHGAVVGIEGFSPVPVTAEVPAMTDPSGVALGATEDAVLKAHPDARRMSSTLGPVLVATISERYLASYAFEGGRLNAIDWFARASTDPPRDGPPLTERTCDSPETAILDLQKTETDGIRWELLWQRFHPCDGTTKWLKSVVATSQQNERRYDAVTLTCPTSGAKRVVYFDITPFFGKF